MGRVTKKIELPNGKRAYFVDLGENKEAFMNAEERGRDELNANEGQEVIVQVLQEQRAVNGRLGNMNVDEAVITAERIGAKLNIPNHYGMFASNTEDPTLFTSRVKNSLALEFNEEYDARQILDFGK